MLKIDYNFYFKKEMTTLTSEQKFKYFYDFQLL